MEDTAAYEAAVLAESDDSLTEEARRALPEQSSEAEELLPLGLKEDELIEKLGWMLYSATLGLKDQSSVLFEQVCLRRGRFSGKEYLFLHAYANAKNSYGAYVGKKEIYAIDGEHVSRSAYDDLLSVYLIRDGKKWFAPMGYFVCFDFVDDAIVAKAARRLRGVSPMD